MADNRTPLPVRVPSKGGEPPEEDPEPAGPAPPKQLNDPAADLSEDDRVLKEKLELLVERAQDSSAELQKTALESMATEMREATSSMTSVPKPLKFLSPHYDTLKKLYETSVAASNKALLADVLSVLGMVLGQETRDCLTFKLAGNRTELGQWGHEYVRHVAGEIAEEYNERTEAEPPKDVTELIALVHNIVPFHMAHNAEAEAVDLLLETDQLSTLVTSGHIDHENYARVCLYLLRCGDYVGDTDDSQAIFEVAFRLYLNVGKQPDALRVALKMSSMDRIKEAMAACTDEATKKQMGFILGRHRAELEVDDDDDLAALVGNEKLSEYFAGLARELDVTDAKTPEDIYKSHLAETGSTARNRGDDAPVDSARANLASTLVNAFVNAGYATDKLVSPTDSNWIYRNKDNAVMSVTASLGMVLQWNVDALSEVDKFVEEADPFAKGGGLLAVGLVCANIRNEIDPALSLLCDYLDDSESQPKPVRTGALLGLGLAYAGSAREDVAALLTPFIADTSAKADMEVVSIAGLALGLVYVGSADDDTAAVFAQRLMEASPAELDNPMARHLALGLGLLFLNKAEAVDGMIMAMETIEHPIQKVISILLNACAFAGTGNVLKIQEMLHICAEHPEAESEKAKEDASKEAASAAGAGAGAGAGASAASAGASASASDGKDKDKSKDSNTSRPYLYQSMAVVGMSLVTLGEELGMNMLSRTAEHLLQYGDASVKRAVPLALAMAHISDPDYSIVDALSKLTHDTDGDTAMSAIMALGLVGAGTNNSRIAGLLRQLTVFYAKEPNQLFVVRLAQGLLHMAKGLMSLNPFHSDRLLMSGPALGGLLTVIVACLDFPNTLLGKHHYLMFALAVSMSPRCLITVDEDLEPVQVNVRVGQAVDTVGQAGRPKTITGFQTHETPVLLGSKDRAELADDGYEALSSVLEGIVILRKKPEDAGAGVGAGAAAGGASS